MLTHARAQDRDLERAGAQAQAAQRYRETARAIALDGRLDRERADQAWSASISKKYPRLFGPLREAVTLDDAEREDVLRQLRDVEVALTRGAEYAREQSAYHGRLKRKYGLAAVYPWMPLAPDPPRRCRRS
jgi:hypothetical protein